ncbi:hypothetical protein LguiB_013837 [Lonicera macranthoides]
MKLPVEILIDKEIMVSKISIFRLAMTFQRIRVIRKSIDNVNLEPSGNVKSTCYPRDVEYCEDDEQNKSSHRIIS